MRSGFGRAARWLVAVAVLVTGVAACGDDDGSSASSDRSSTTSSTVSTTRTTRRGFLANRQCIPARSLVDRADTFVAQLELLRVGSESEETRQEILRFVHDEQAGWRDVAPGPPEAVVQAAASATKTLDAMEQRVAAAPVGSIVDAVGPIDTDVEAWRQAIAPCG